MMIVLSHVQATKLLKARDQARTTLTLTLDLGMSTADVGLEADAVLLPDGQRLDWAQVEDVAGSENSCFGLEDGELDKIQSFSVTTNRVYTLYPTDLAPTMLVSGIPMHRIKGTNPHKDTLSKIKTIKPVTGNVLDTNTGLGYTAIRAAQTANSVTTIELDPAVLELCKQNPWSQELFTNPKIHQIIGDSYDVVMELDDGAYNRIIHDPPTFSLAGDLYSEEFYAELYRLLARGGRLFHYIGDLDSNLGRRVSRGAIQRLQEVGFRRVKPRKDAFGVVAYK